MNETELISKPGEIVLEVRDISKVFPGTVALQHASIVFKRGEVHGIIGKNGAGKSTLVSILSGIIRPSGGQVFVNGKLFTGFSPVHAKKEGITIAPQRPETIPDFTVIQSLFLPNYYQHATGILDWKRMAADARQIMESTGFEIDLNRRMSDLTLSEQQLFLIIKAFYFDKAEIVILDEVTTSFSGKEQALFFRIIEAQRILGKSIIFISHRIDEVMVICDRVTVIRDGRAIKTVDRSGLEKDLLCSLIVGEGSGNLQSCEIPESGAREALGEEVLRVEGFNRRSVFEDISFSLRHGEILGIAGLVGSGRTEILKAIAGIYPLDSGTLKLSGGSSTRFKSPNNSLQEGVVYFPEDRDEEGLVGTLSVRKNATLSYLIRIAVRSLIRQQKERNLTRELIETLEILTSSQEEDVQNLSGGNRQKVLAGRVWATQAKVLLLDEPTKGIDIAAKESILNSVKTKMTKIAGVVITSPGLEDLLSICDRILVLYDGRLVDEFQREQFDEMVIYQAVQGILRPGANPTPNESHEPERIIGR
jgi:ABC-type sugar transport system ATPase subunit